MTNMAMNDPRPWRIQTLPTKDAPLRLVHPELGILVEEYAPQFETEKRRAATPYDEAVSRNLTHMGTPATEWNAVEFEMVNDGVNPVFPSCSFPSGYTQAPSLFKSAGSDANCELCGHAIKICFALQNDTKRWVMTVGSECVTHFGTGQSGKELAAEKIKSEKRQFLRNAQLAMEKVAAEINGKWDLSTQENRDKLNRLHNVQYRIRRQISGYRADESMGWRNGKSVKLAPSTDAEVSGWYRARKAKIEKILSLC